MEDVDQSPIIVRELSSLTFTGDKIGTGLEIMKVNGGDSHVR